MPCLALLLCLPSALLLCLPSALLVPNALLVPSALVVCLPSALLVCLPSALLVPSALLRCLPSALLVPMPCCDACPVPCWCPQRQQVLDNDRAHQPAKGLARLSCAGSSLWSCSWCAVISATLQCYLQASASAANLRIFNASNAGRSQWWWNGRCSDHLEHAVTHHGFLSRLSASFEEVPSQLSDLPLERKQQM